MVYVPRKGRKPDGTHKTPQKIRTRQFSHDERKRGNLERQPCEICGIQSAECHHIDYSDPSRIMRLCLKHHKQTHSQFGCKPPPDWLWDIRCAQNHTD
jgi:hypothetical protein